MEPLPKAQKVKEEMKSFNSSGHYDAFEKLFFQKIKDAEFTWRGCAKASDQAITPKEIYEWLR
jgi:hypothetical protein